MLKKRLVAVVLVKNGWAVQSFGYKRYLPLGAPECLVENFDRWGADEILVLSIDRSIAGVGPDFALLEKLARMGLKTPLIYGGGVRSEMDGLRLIQFGADRICIDVLMRDDIETVQKISRQLGAQAIIGALPLSWRNDHIEWLDYRSRDSSPLSEQVLNEISNHVSELLVIDWLHEGMPGEFDQRLVAQIPVDEVPLIAFGGLSESDQMKDLLLTQNIAAVAIGNFLSYKEHAVQKYKELLAGMPLRLSDYETQYPLL